MKKNGIPSCGSWLFSVLLFAGLQFHVSAARVRVSASPSVHEPVAGETVNVTVSSLQESMIYYAELVVNYDTEVLEFISVKNGSLMQDGINIAGELAAGMAGVSVSRINPLQREASGTIMYLEFRVRNNAAGGDTGIVFTDLVILDANAVTIDSEVPAPVFLNIVTGISGLKLLTGLHHTIESGEPFHIRAEVTAPGVVDPARIRCQAGVSSQLSDPVSWDEEMWTDMTPDGDGSTGIFLYSAEIAFMRECGEWFIALRSSLDEGSFVYGGPEGLLHEPDLRLAALNIIPRPPYRYTIASWNFDNESLLPFASIRENRGSAFQVAGASFTGFLTGYRGLAANANGWSNTGSGLCYWWTEVSTAGFTSIEISSRQYGSGTGPRDFLLEYSLDGFLWKPAIAEKITVGSNWSSGVINKLLLPRELDNRERVLMRWIPVSDISVNGTVTGPSGTNRIDDIIITGINPGPQQAMVFPGDANNDGTVNADDVLPLGIYWLNHGPPAVWETLEFIPRSTELWIPSGATFADTNGDGLVDHRDLLAVGLHFSKSAGSSGKGVAASLASLTVDIEQEGRIVRFLVKTGEKVSMRGMAFSIELGDIPGNMWKIAKVMPLFTDGYHEGEILSFSHLKDNIFEAAFVLKGYGNEINAQALAGIELVIDEQWSGTFTVNLNRLSVSNNYKSGPFHGGGGLFLTDTLISSAQGKPPVACDLALQIIPNPVGDFSDIRFCLDVPSRVRLEITCLQGRVVSVPVHGFYLNGCHSVTFESSQLPPAIYLCRLVTPGGSMTLRMMKLQ
jgi:hypothetical protein